MNQNVLSPHGGPGSQPPTHTMPQQSPGMVPPPTSTPNQLATQLLGMNLSGQPPPPLTIQNSVSKLYFHTKLPVCLCLVFLYSLIAKCIVNSWASPLLLIGLVLF